MITHAWRELQVHGQRLFLCLLCDRYSANPHDAERRYCGFCGVFLEDIPMDFRPHPVTPLRKPTMPPPIPEEVPEWQERRPGHLRRWGYHLNRRHP